MKISGCVKYMLRIYISYTIELQIAEINSIVIVRLSLDAVLRFLCYINTNNISIYIYSYLGENVMQLCYRKNIVL